MRPEDSRPQPHIFVPPRMSSAPPVNDEAKREAASALIRQKIDAIYANDPNATMTKDEETTSSTEQPQEAVATPPEKTPASTTDSTPDPNVITPGPGAINMQAANQPTSVANPYERTHDETQHQLQANAWQKYHSAWQSYYQQYYERYYVSQVHEAKKSLETEAHVNQPEDAMISTDEAMYDLRGKLRNQIATRAKKVRKSRHFAPVIAALLTMLIFVFLQYNRVIFAMVDAYITPGSANPANLIIDPSVTTAVPANPLLIVPDISVDAPIVWDANAASEDSLNAAMAKGVAWFDIQGASAKPGEMGNFVISGHSSNDWLDQGDYKFVFARLDQLANGAPIYVNYNSIRYTYVVTGKKVVSPTDISALQVGTDKPRITLLTCTPLGTALNRLLVFGDQVSPDPTSATAASTSTSTTATAMPANSPTFLQRLFGISN